MAEGQTPAAAAKKAPDTVKVQVLAGRVLKSREAVKDEEGRKIDSIEHYAEVGEIFDAPRAWAEKLVKRELEAYPGIERNGTITPGASPGVVRDTTIKIVG